MFGSTHAKHANSHRSWTAAVQSENFVTNIAFRGNLSNNSGFTIWIRFWRMELNHNSSKCTGILVMSTFSQMLCSTTGWDIITAVARSACPMTVSISAVKNWLVRDTAASWRQTVPELGTHRTPHSSRWGYVRYECGGSRMLKHNKVTRMFFNMQECRSFFNVLLPGTKLGSIITCPRASKYSFFK